MTNHHRISRRTFLKTAAASAAAVTISPILPAPWARGGQAGTPGRFVVVVNMLGGNDGLNTVVPTHLQPYYDRRPNLSLDVTDDGLLALDGSFYLHGNLNNLKTLWDGNDMHVVHKVSYPNPNQSHFTSQDIYSYGIRNNESDGDGRGWLGRFADEYCASPPDPLGVISVGVGRRVDFESETTAPLVVGSNLDAFSIDGDNRYRADHALRLLTVRETLDTEPVPVADPALTIFSTNVQAHELVDRVQQETEGWADPGTYPNSTLGRNMRTISQLLHARDSFGTKVLYTGFGGFDTHSNQAGRHNSLMAQLDGALGAFADDMKARNLWQDCVVVVISEFGRRNFENGSAGTDHGWGNAFLVAGGRVKGQAQGGGMTGELSESDLSDNGQLPFAHDFRDVYTNVIESHIGVSADPLFPDPGYTADRATFDIV